MTNMSPEELALTHFQSLFLISRALKQIPPDWVFYFTPVRGQHTIIFLGSASAPGHKELGATFGGCTIEADGSIDLRKVNLFFDMMLTAAKMYSALS